MDKVDHQPSNETRHRLRLSVGLTLAFVLPFIVVTMYALLDHWRILPPFLLPPTNEFPWQLIVSIMSGLVVICFLQLTVRKRIYIGIVFIPVMFFAVVLYYFFFLGVFLNLHMTGMDL